MRKLYLLLFLCAGFLTEIACSDKKENAPDTFGIDEALLTQEFTNAEGVVSIPVKTTLAAKAWSVESDADWCKVTPYATSFSIAVSANTDANIREAKVTVTSTLNNYTVRVTQLGAGKAILVRPNSVTVNPEGEEISLKVTANIPYELKVPENCDWMRVLPNGKAAEERIQAFEVDANNDYATRQVVVRFVGTEDATVIDSCVITQSPRSSSAGDIELEGDIRVKPTRGAASENQPGQGIENCFDGKFSADGGAPYHSIWGQTAQFPVTLEFFFDGTQDIDYLIYYTRSGNGNFGKLKIYTATQSAPDYTLAGDYDFRMQNAPSKVVFKEGLKKVTKIKFSVESGMNDFVSCDEMEFYRKNIASSLDEKLLTVFQDITCSELRKDVTATKINALPGYFARVATALQNGEYNDWQRDFRIRDYEAYSYVEEWAEKLMTKKYSNLDNPTGIYAEAGDTLIVLVGDTHGQSVALQSITEARNGSGADSYMQVQASGDMYLLSEGVNKICMRNSGMLFLMYNTTLPAEPVRVHIPIGSGTVNGFFDLNEHKTDTKYAELLRKATYKYFCVRGEKIMFYFHREKMLEHVPNEILSAINLWDNIIGWQQELMGIENVRPSQVNNHLFAISPEGSYMWASDYQIAFVYTYLGNILLYDNVMSAKDNAWGPAHEIGHIHQQAINWPGCTESSNNLFSNYILYKLGKYCSRGTELSALATNRLINSQPWVTMGSATHQNEDTEIHMRMNWQLWNYYHRCGYKTDFWQTLFKLLRNDRIVESDPGGAQLKFAMRVCESANENLTDFFEMWGFFEPVDMTIEQYGTWKYKVTDKMIADAKAYMAQFPEPKHAFYYLEDRKNGDVGIESYRVGDVGYWTQFRDDQKITKTVTYTLADRKLTIHDGAEAVAFEIRKGDTLLFFSNFLSFEVPASVSLESAQVYAVQADGKRLLLTKQ